MSLALATFLAVRLLKPLTSSGPGVVEDRLHQLLPDTDPLLVHRVAGSWGLVAVQAAEQHQQAGLMVLEAFEDEAAYCLQHDPKALVALVRVVNLDPERFRLTCGPWNRAVLDWAQSGSLDRFLNCLGDITSTQLAVAESVPAALPLLGAKNVPVAQGILRKYDDRACACS